MEKRNKIITTINNTRLEIDGAQAFMSLGTFLREEQNLTGTKIVCAEGDCGACTVLLARSEGSDGKLKFKAVNSCILPLYLIDGAHVVTVEGIADSSAHQQVLSEVQQKMVDCNGAQCGYCTPGFICTMAGVVEKFKTEGKVITEKHARNYLTGNLCRCTGYRPILEAMTSLEQDKAVLMKERYHNPIWLAEMKRIRQTAVEMKFSRKSLFLPTSLEEALKIKAQNEMVRLIAGSTDVGVVVNKGKMDTPQAMALYHIEELGRITHDQNFLWVGATVTLTEFEDYIENHFPEMANMLHIFASPQIKNQGTLVGNVVNGSPIADTIPFLMVSDAMVEIQSEGSVREVVLSKFYVGYKQLDLKAHEIVTRIKIPLLRKNEKLRLYKVSMRRDLDISAVTFAGRILLNQDKIADIRLAYGGVAATVVRLSQMESHLVGQRLTRDLFGQKASELPLFISPLSDLRASKEYRMQVSKNFLKKFGLEIAQEAGL